MKLDDLIKYLKSSDKLEQLIVSEKLNTESETILIYMEESLDINSKIKFFDIEETNGDITFEKDGVKYISLFTTYHAMELIESDLDLIGKGYSDLKIAQRLLEYRINDA